MLNVNFVIRLISPQMSFCPKRDLRAPSADRRRILPHDRTLIDLYNACAKI